MPTMNDRSYEDAADEFDGLSFYQAVSRYAVAFADLSHGELMALGGKFLELASSLSETSDDERRTSASLAEAIEEVILFRLAGNNEGIRSYLAAKQAHLEYLHKYSPAAVAPAKNEPSAPLPARESSSWVSGWFGKRK
jgi:hypothetical protein